MSQTVPSPSALPLTYALFDCQAFSAPEHPSVLLEVGWEFVENSIVRERFVSLLCPAFDVEIPTRVRRLTGISSESFVGKPSSQEIACALAEFLEREPTLPLFAYHAPFERKHLCFLLGQAGLSQRSAEFSTRLRSLRDTCRVLLPGLPNYSLAAVAGSLGAELPLKKRSDAHLTSMRALVETLQGTLQPRSDSQMQHLWESLPNRPGIYRLHGSHNQILYIGTSQDIKKRVQQHFRTKNRRKIRGTKVTMQTTRVSYETALTSIEAALLESDEIKRWDPLYNVRLKAASRQVYYLDWYKLTLEPRPRAPLVGPFSSASQATAVVEAIAVMRTLTTGPLCTLRTSQWRSSPSLFVHYAHLLGNMAFSFVRKDNQIDVDVQKMSELLFRASHLILRGRLLVTLYGSFSSWSTRREHGSVHLPSLPHGSATSSRWGVLPESLLQFDRASVLAEQLQRVVARGGNAHVRLPFGVAMDHDISVLATLQHPFLRSAWWD